MMKKLLLFTLILSGFQAFAQKELKSYVEKNMVTVRTVEPDSTDFSDFEAIGNAIGNSKIVMLGEQDHGDAPTFLAKTRLIKYLHEKKGFNVLAFESDFYALTKGWEMLEKQKNLVTPFLRGNIFGVWTSCKQCENLFYDYIPGTMVKSNPLTIAGFDSQVHGSYSNKTMKKFMDDYLQSRNVAFAKTEAYKNDFLPFIDSVMRSNDLEKEKAFGNAVSQILDQLPQKDSTTFEMLVVKNLLTGSKIGVARLSKVGDYLMMRDKQMGENLQWLVKYKYPDQKIIVWAHNGHILKNPDQIRDKVAIKNPMGNVFVKGSSLGNSTYIIGFDSRNGSAGRINLQQKFTVQNPPKNSFETFIPETTKYAFIDFKGFRNENPTFKEYFKLKGIAHSETTAVWTNVFDGIFYIRDMYPCDVMK